MQWPCMYCIQFEACMYVQCIFCIKYCTKFILSRLVSFTHTSVDFGVVDKLELGPKLEHVTKSRPKPVGRRRPSRKPVMTDDVDGRASHPLLSSLATVSNGETAKAVAESSHISSAKKEETDGRSSPKGSKSPKKQAQSLYVPSKHQT